MSDRTIDTLPDTHICSVELTVHLVADEGVQCVRLMATSLTESTVVDDVCPVGDPLYVVRDELEAMALLCLLVRTGWPIHVAPSVDGTNVWCPFIGVA